MVQRQCHKRCRWEPDRHDLSADIPSGDGEEDGHADEPVCADAAEENLLPAGLLGFLDGVGDGLVAVGRDVGENPSVADYDGHEEEHAAEIADVGYYPGGEDVSD